MLDKRRWDTEREYNSPRLRSDQKENTELDKTVDERLGDDAGQDPLRDEGTGRSFGVDLGVRKGSTHCGEKDISRSDQIE